MRRHGSVRSAVGFGPSEHLGWGYVNRAEFRYRAAEYIGDGLARNEWILFVGAASRAALRAELADLGFSEGVRSGQIWVAPVEDYYTFRPGSDVVDPQAMMTRGIATLEELLATGCPGCRAVVDGTAVAHTPEQRDALARFEFLTDRTMTMLPVSALCTYDVTVLGAAAKELLCLHPLTNAGAVGFQLYAERDSGFALSGEIDADEDHAFTAAFRRIWPLMAQTELVIDAEGLRFVTHRQLIALDEQARADGREVILRTGQRVVTRLAELLGLDNVRVEAAADRRHA
ncbi:MEDS domain-containing protein [Mycobacterium botniense]|uniref:MEDS domain-containing protein n=1 Tax=Mycobacterium botniense TaxID=84962 RepID=A0A7I9XUI1_9MYCO|nr:MEDS domain-containing protein [Mycobacterium botniense]GFG73478.1 hypothetical protein MBOT_08430 [Mycobacterium botniense]